LLVALAAVLAVAGAPADEAADPRDIDRLVAELRAAEFTVRQAAELALVEIGPDALPALEKAARDPDPEVAMRARRALAAVRKIIVSRTHRLLDAEGKPMGGATAQITMRNPQTGEHTEVRMFTADRLGYLSLSDLRGRAHLYVIASRPDLGRARRQIRWSGRTRDVVLPMVRKSSAAHERAASGRVVGPHGEPVRDAGVSCSSIRTPGEGLIQWHYSADVLTDDRGRFTLYLPTGDDRRGERGKLIPPNSRFFLLVRPPAESGLFPCLAECRNTQAAGIVLKRPGRSYVLKFEKEKGGFLESGEELRGISLAYSEQSRGRGFSVDLGPARKSAKLLPGWYRARHQSVEYLPLELSEESPRELVFRLPPAVTYRGRVVMGVSGAPRGGAFVIGMSSVAHNNLALLTEQEWDRMEKLPCNPSVKDPILNRLRSCYGLESIARTDAQGRYELAAPRGRDIYGVIAFARDRLPFEHRARELKAGADGFVNVPDLVLYPAAKALVRPVSPGERISVWHEWLIDEEDQPAWAAGFLRAMEGKNAEIERLHWLKLDEKEPIYVPAGLRLRVRFSTPYHQQWTVVGPDQTIVVKQGDTVDIGDLAFVPSARISVTVVNREGNPVEGIPVRRHVHPGRAWSVPHNTDAKGVARFFAPSGSSGQMGVRDFPDRDAPEAKAANLTAPFRVAEDGQLVEACVIRLTDRQIELVLGGAQ